MGTAGTKKQRGRYRLNKKKSIKVLVMIGFVTALFLAILKLLAGVNIDLMWTGISIDLKGRSIVLDAGHGGFDPGAIGVNSVREDELNLAIAQQLKTGLEKCGAQVIMTRSDENALAGTKDADMAERKRIIEQSGSDIVISIHMNSFTDHSVSGPVTLFMPGSGEGQKLAAAVQESLNTRLGASGSIRSGNLYILRSGNQPCVLVECGYISNEEEAAKLSRQDYQFAVARAVCEGVGEYFLQKEG